MKCFLEKGANLHLKSEGGQTALIVAGAKGRARTVRVLLRAGANVNAKDNHGNTGLVLVADSFGQDRNSFSNGTARALLEAGANPNARNRLGYTALMFAASSMRLSLSKILWQYGADVNIRSNEGETALSMAYAFRSYGNNRDSFRQLANWLRSVYAVR